MTKGALRAYTYTGDSGKAVHCFHCGNCTTHAYSQMEFMPGVIDVHLTPLDDGALARTTDVECEIYGQGQVPVDPRDGAYL